MTQPRVLGIDLSLTGTGLAYSTGDAIAIRTVRTKPYGPTLEDSWQRLKYIESEIWKTATSEFFDLVLIEGPSYGSKGAGTWDRGGLWWLVVSMVLAHDMKAVSVPPTLVKKYATGKGGGPGISKATVCSAAGNRYGRVFATDDEADAYVLCAMGLDHLGDPPAVVPKLHREALAKVQWPGVSQ